jgi:predicted Fe-Mo cluster-binding NifX family protein
MIIAMPVLDDRGRESKISMHFGHNPLFAVCDTERGDVRIINIGGHGEGCTPVGGLKKYKPDMVYTIDIGGRAMLLLREMGIGIKTGKFMTVGDVLENIDRLEELDEGCGR